MNRTMIESVMKSGIFILYKALCVRARRKDGYQYVSSHEVPKSEVLYLTFA
jgi:hypothetical protein